MPSIKELEQWMTAGQVAASLGYTRQHIFKLAKARRIRSVHVGSSYEGGRGMWIFDPTSVAEYAKKREKE